MSKEKRLGRGLSALLGEESRKREAPEEIRIDRIVPNPHQPRRNFDEEALAELAASIRTHGVVQPVIVRREADGYTLIAGERRLRASKLAGLTTVPAIIRDYNEEAAAEVALVENLQREDLNPVEEGRAYRRLMETYGYTQEKLAGIVGKSRPYVANLLRILALPEEVLAQLEEGKLTMGQVRPLLALASEEEQTALARRIEKENLSSRQAEELVRGKKEKRAPKEKAEDPAASYFRKIENELKLSLGTGVHIRNGKGKNRLRGAIAIEYTGEEEFQRIVAFLKNEE